MNIIHDLTELFNNYYTVSGWERYGGVTIAFIFGNFFWWFNAGSTFRSSVKDS